MSKYSFECRKRTVCRSCISGMRYKTEIMRSFLPETPDGSRTIGVDHDHYFLFDKALSFFFEKPKGRRRTKKSRFSSAFATEVREGFDRRTNLLTDFSAEACGQDSFFLVS